MGRLRRLQPAARRLDGRGQHRLRAAARRPHGVGVRRHVPGPRQRRPLARRRGLHPELDRRPAGRQARAHGPRRHARAPRDADADRRRPPVRRQGGGRRLLVLGQRRHRGRRQASGVHQQVLDVLRRGLRLRVARQRDRDLLARPEARVDPPDRLRRRRHLGLDRRARGRLPVHLRQPGHPRGQRAHARSRQGRRSARALGVLERHRLVDPLPGLAAAAPRQRDRGRDPEGRRRLRARHLRQQRAAVPEHHRLQLLQPDGAVERADPGVQGAGDGRQPLLVRRAPAPAVQPQRKAAAVLQRQQLRLPGPDGRRARLPAAVREGEAAGAVP